MLRYSVILPFLAGVILQGILVGILLTKRMWQKFPVFLSYCASNFALGVALFIMYLSRRPSPTFWFRAYWINEAIGLLLGLGVVYEIFRHLIAPYRGLQRLASLVLRAALILLVLIGGVLASFQPTGQDFQLTRTFQIVAEAARILEVGLLFFIFLFASIFGLHWRQYVFGVALGLGFFTVVELVRVTMRVHFGVVSAPILDTVRIVSCNLGLLIWISYLLAPELAASPSEMPKRAQLEQWNRAVMELIYQ